MNTELMGEICFCCGMALFFFFLWQKIRSGVSGTKHACQKTSGEKNTFLEEGAVFLLSCIYKSRWFHFKRERLENLRKIYIGMDEEKIFFEHYTGLVKQISTALLLGFFLVSASVFIKQKPFLFQGYFLEREDTAGKTKKYTLRAHSGEEEKKLEVNIPNRKFTKKEEETALKETKQGLEKIVLGENPSAEKITKSCRFPKEIPEKRVSIHWKIAKDGPVSENGSLKNEELEAPVQTELKAVLTCGNSETVWTKAIIVYPASKKKKDFWEQWEEAYQENEKKSEVDKYVKLPEKVAGKHVTYSEEQLSYPVLLLAGVFALCLILPLLFESRLREKLKKRQEQLVLDYPEFIEHFVLLIGAGLTVKGAWEKIVHEYDKRRKKEDIHYVYEEMAVTFREVENGMSEVKAYELFGKRTGLLAYMKFCTLLVQNLQKGSADLLVLLEYEMVDSFQSRKDNAKALGEKAGTKLLMPMAVMLIIVFVLILYAAFQNM